MRSVPLCIGGVLLLIGCRKDPALVGAEVPSLFPLELPPGAAMPSVREDNPLTTASVRLGKSLFFEKGLSRTGTLSCSGCHFSDRAFSDTLPRSFGVNGEQGMRNAPSLANVAYHPALFRDGGVPTLELQVLAPIHDHLEMDHDINQAAAALREQEPFATLSQEAYGRPLDAYVITRAIANYERTLLSGWSRYDRFVHLGEPALTEQELRGMDLFHSSTAGCASCHSGQDLSDHAFYNIGQYLDYADNGRERITQDPADDGKFKVPTLRNIALTAPYMHDGTMATLGEVIDHFASGGLPHPNKNPLLVPFTLSPTERADLIAFLTALTDERSIDQVP
ncbi:MAG: c-type cytochrome [Flavobacteriales bacterium]|nr:c-type cytochrome [Flavobacteriales bacterium]